MINLINFLGMFAFVYFSEPKVTVRSVHPRFGENDTDFQPRLILEVAQMNAQSGSLQFDVSEFTRLPVKETEYLITPAILDEILLEVLCRTSYNVR